jgi:hypothetical protein
MRASAKRNPIEHELSTLYYFFQKLEDLAGAPTIIIATEVP